jgi:hypothetical protein
MQSVEFGTLVNNGIIEIPMIYRREYSSNVRVILLKENAMTDDETTVQERVAAAERLIGIASANPLSLEEIKNERLKRQ